MSAQRRLDALLLHGPLGMLTPTGLLPVAELRPLPVAPLGTRFLQPIMARTRNFAGRAHCMHRTIAPSISHLATAGFCANNPESFELGFSGGRMPALQSAQAPRHGQRARSMPHCTICLDSMVAAEASALGHDGSIKYMWSCESCGHAFVTDTGTAAPN